MTNMSRNLQGCDFLMRETFRFRHTDHSDPKRVQIMSYRIASGGQRMGGADENDEKLIK